MIGRTKNSSSKPLFYIIQPKIDLQDNKNMQEIYHTRNLMLEKEISIEKPKQDLENIAEVTKESQVIKDEVSHVNIELENEMAQLEDHLNGEIEINETEKEESNILIESQSSREEVELPVKKEKAIKPELLKRIARLARYPLVVDKPICQLRVDGEWVEGQIDSKRGKLIKVNCGQEIKWLKIEEIEEILIMS